MMDIKRFPIQTACCHKCERQRIECVLLADLIPCRTMIVCPNCGNKRCPKASDHDLPCSDSNEPGQPGSVYGS